MRRNWISSFFGFLIFCCFLISPAMSSEQSSSVGSQGATVASGLEDRPMNATPDLKVSPYQFILQTVQFFLFGFFIYYMLVLRPKQLEEENHARFIKELKKDDEIVTTGGIIGKVILVAEDFVTIEISQGVKVKIQKQHLKALRPKEGGTSSKGVVSMQSNKK